MVRERPAVHAFGVDGPILAAILDVLGDIHDLLDARLPKPDGGGGGVPVRISEPAPAEQPPGTVPVSEPAPDGPTGDDDKPVAEPAPDLPEPPPRAGRGSSLAAWQAWASAVGVGVDDDMTRDQIIDACVTAGVLSNT